MENETSPLAAFPREHSAHTPTHLFAKSHSVIFLLIALIALGLGVFGGYMFLGKDTKPLGNTQSAITASWKTYTNTPYGYELQYDTNMAPKEANTQYGYTELANGCMKVYAVSQTVVPTLVEEKNGIPWKQLNDLKTLPVGESRNCSVLMFTFGEDGSAVVNRNDYTRQPSQKISGVDWYSFRVKNDESTAVTNHQVYFIEKNDMTYVIETKTGGVCPTTPNTMLTTFSFTQ